MLTDPKSTKKLLDLTHFFALLGPECVKSACRTLMKLTPALVYRYNTFSVNYDYLVKVERPWSFKEDYSQAI